MIILQILKVIGIVLACIVGLVLLILLLVLFAPVNYSTAVQVHGSDISVKASAGWLIKLLSVKAEYAEKNFSYSVRAAGISILSSEEKEKKNKKNSTDKPEFPEGSSASDGFDYFDEDENKFEELLSESGEKKKIPAEKPAPGTAWQKDESDNCQKSVFAAAPRQRKRRSLIEIIREKITSFIQKIKDSYERIRRMYEKAKTVKYIACAPVTRKAFVYAKDRLFKLLKSIRPRGIKGSIAIGTEDPSQSALIYGTLAAVSAQLSKKLYVYPELENKKTDIDIVIRGRIFIGYIALMALQIYTNKDVNRVIRYIRRNLLNGG